MAMKAKLITNKLCKMNFVKPLYKTAHTDVSVIDANLEGNDICIQKNIVVDNNCVVKSVIVKSKHCNEVKLPRTNEIRNENVLSNIVKSVDTSVNMLGLVGSSKGKHEEIELGRRSTRDQTAQADGARSFIIHKLPDNWLRFYPASIQPNESFCSVLVRSVFSQLGLIIILILWTVLWTYVIFLAEESFEVAVSEDFRKKQNELVISLATELRQITPISVKWRETIEKRINHERELTIGAVGRGARLEPGCFWSLAGTFLFNVYVMTALGFGAPVPQTVYGRTAALVYAIVAVPTHIYLMVNLSTCIVTRMDAYCRRKCGREQQRRTVRHRLQSATSSTLNKVLLCVSMYFALHNASTMRTDTELLCCLLRIATFGHGVPLAAVLYYSFGAVGFGVLRGRDTVSTVMYPLDFTTSGGLDRIKGHIRFLYGLFVEGAMLLLACMLVSLRRYSSRAIGRITQRYRLFVAEKCAHCVESVMNVVSYEHDRWLKRSDLFSKPNK